MENINKVPKVSVIVPVYKVDKYLTQCIQSIVEQTLKDIEIIIVDEGDRDRCRDIIDYYQSIDSRIIAPHKKNGGYGASCNLGFDIAKGEYITIVESDDFIDKNMYKQMYYFAKKLDADVVKTPYYEYFNDGVKRDCYYKQRMIQSTPCNCCFSIKEFPDLMRVHASVWSGIYKRSYMVKNNIRFMEKGAYVDVGFRIESLIHTSKIVWLDMPFYYYRMDNPGSTTNNFNIRAMINRWKDAHVYLEKYRNDYNRYYGKTLFMDEYINAVERYWETPVSKELYMNISDNLKFVDDGILDKLDELSEKKISELKLLKYNPQKYYKKYSFRNNLIRINNRYKIMDFFKNHFSTETMLYSTVTYASCYYTIYNLGFCLAVDKVLLLFLYCSFYISIGCIIGKIIDIVLKICSRYFGKIYGKHI